MPRRLKVFFIFNSVTKLIARKPNLKQQVHTVDELYLSNSSFWFQSVLLNSNDWYYHTRYIRIEAYGAPLSLLTLQWIRRDAYVCMILLVRIITHSVKELMCRNFSIKILTYSKGTAKFNVHRKVPSHFNAEILPG